MRSRFTLICSLVAVLFCGAPSMKAQREKLPPEDYDLVYQKWPKMQKSNAGIRYLVLTPGNGPIPKAGDKVEVYYKGSLLQGGKVFDSNQGSKKPFSFRVDRGEVISGWDSILKMIPAGSKWLVVIPPEMAYGSRGQPPQIPRDASLVFEIEVLRIVPE
jgi:FKBP-type peptidyl-prolyl cis-trans isomerase